MWGRAARAVPCLPAWGLSHADAVLVFAGRPAQDVAVAALQLAVRRVDPDGCARQAERLYSWFDDKGKEHLHGDECYAGSGWQARGSEPVQVGMCVMSSYLSGMVQCTCVKHRVPASLPCDAHPLGSPHSTPCTMRCPCEARAGRPSRGGWWCLVGKEAVPSGL